MADLPIVSQPVHLSGALLDHLARRVRVRAERELEPLGLRPRHVVTLVMLRLHDGTTQTSLAELLQIDRTNLIGLLNDLERDGLVERRRPSEDRRRRTVALTTRGHERLAQVEVALAATEAEVLGELDDAERELLYGLLLRASDHVSIATTVSEAVNESRRGSADD